uniref:Uncharacterized protein n=1 Tax=Oryctolagus cuniculus TaxID=9986 RepID=A0A5F9D5Y9_RABIT
MGEPRTGPGAFRGRGGSCSGNPVPAPNGPITSSGEIEDDESGTENREEKNNLQATTESALSCRKPLSRGALRWEGGW